MNAWFAALSVDQWYRSMSYQSMPNVAPAATAAHTRIQVCEGWRRGTGSVWAGRGELVRTGALQGLHSRLDLAGGVTAGEAREDVSIDVLHARGMRGFDRGSAIWVDVSATLVCQERDSSPRRVGMRTLVACRR